MSYSPVLDTSPSLHIRNENTEVYTHISAPCHSKEHTNAEAAELPVKEPNGLHSALHPLEEGEAVQLDQLSGQHEKVRGIIQNIWLIAFLPGVAFAYLALCYVAATRLVSVHIWAVDQPTEHAYKIKAGLTTINIIVVAISLLPLKTLLDDIKSEEFFRALHQSDSGVPLRDINSISIPSHTIFRGIQAIIKGHASRYYTGTIVCGILAASISSLAPAALSVGLVLADDDIRAIEVGAIGIDSAYRFGSGLETIMINEVLKSKAGEAATMGWVRGMLGAEIAFTPTSPKYAVPPPLNIDPTARVRYLTDVVIMDPICNWTVPTLSPSASSFFNFSGSWSMSPVDFVLHADFGITIQKTESSISKSSEWAETKALSIPGDEVDPYRIRNSTTLDPATDGTMAWMIAHCRSCTRNIYLSDQSVLDLSGLPTEVFNFSVNRTYAAGPYTTEYSILVCNPRALIETREVVLDGTGKIEVLENTGLTRQGNLHALQTNLLLGNGLMMYSTESGPQSEFDGLGSAAQVKLLFGYNLGDPGAAPVLKPQSIEKITEEFTLAQQAALCLYLSGVFGTAYVPGRVQVTKLVFTSSLPHVIVSTILFALVVLFVNISYFRPSVEQFTLFSIATVLSRSNARAICDDAKHAKGAQESAWVSLPIHGPARLADYSLNRHQADVSLGTPPQNASLFVSIAAAPMYALTPECHFCPPEGIYDPRYSSSASFTSDRWGSTNASGVRGRETITLGGVLQDKDAPIVFVDNMLPKFYPRFSGGHLGLYVPPMNDTIGRARSIMQRLHDQGQLLNPVWGLRLGGAEPRLTIGALDPNEYQGEINWVPMSFDEHGFPFVQVDSLRGYQGNLVPLQYPVTAWMDTFARGISLPDVTTVITSTILGPQQVYMDRDNTSFAVLCNNSETPNNPVEFSVGINGILYPINQLDLVRAESSLSPARNYCHVGIAQSDDSTFGLGVTFLRSVYLAFRFPSETCPGYWGFATPKGSPVPSPTQTPRTTPTDADTCLSFVKPTSTPTPTIASYTGLLGSDGKKYRVNERPDEQWVQLRGADEIKERKVTGSKAGFGG